MNTYGMHSIHGRAPAIATGVAVARPDLDVWVITGDGDGLSIGGNHLIHALRRNVNLTILLFNNRIYGLTKGQYSPTSELGKVTKSTPFGSVDPPFNPLAVALGAEASFVARTHDLDRKHMMETFRAAHDHRGASFVEIYQNCNVFNDGQFNDITKKQARDEMMIDLVHGEPIRFGADGQRGVVMGSDGQLRLVDVADVGEDALLVHDAARDDPSLAFALARLSTDDHSPTPFGVFRDVAAPGVRLGDRRPARPGVRAQGPGRPRRAAALERHLERRRHQLTVDATATPAADSDTFSGSGQPVGAGAGHGSRPIQSRRLTIPEADERSRAPSQAIHAEPQRVHEARLTMLVVGTTVVALVGRGRRRRRPRTGPSAPAAPAPPRRRRAGRRRRRRGRAEAAAAGGASRRPRRGGRRRLRDRGHPPRDGRHRRRRHVPATGAGQRRLPRRARPPASSTGHLHRRRRLQAERELFVDGIVGRETALSIGVWPDEAVVRRPHPAAGAGRRRPWGFPLSSVSSHGADAPPVPADSGLGPPRRLRAPGQRVWAIDDDEQIIRSWLVSGSKYGNESPGSTRCTAAPSSPRPGTGRRSCR